MTHTLAWTKGRAMEATNLAVDGGLPPVDWKPIADKLAAGIEPGDLSRFAF